ncbi:MAG: nucleotidyltransferase domain-containing protein [Lactobacillales bacterium]|jgi:predicted nucleotidyltransferase|nr:nucleotidyltransferase domain-containing protein [Lactobacillales bacterium]
MVYTIDEIKEKISPIAKKWGIPLVYLFGSYARGEADDESDIDLAFDYNNSNVVGLDYFTLLRELKSEYKTNIDLLSIDQISEKHMFGNHIEREFEKDKIIIFEKES